MAEVDLDGYVGWLVSISGATLRGIDAPTHYPTAPRLVVTPRENSVYEIRVVTRGLYDRDEAIASTRSVAERFLDELAFQYDASIGVLRHHNQKVPYPPDGPKRGLSIRMLSAETAWINASSTRIISESELGRTVREHLSMEAPTAMRTFRIALAQSDALAKFMLLYNAMLELRGDIQREVDASILSVDASIPVSPSPVKKSENETLFTRLRNELAHHRPGSDLSRTSAEVRKVLPDFVRITRAVIAHARSTSPLD